MELDRVPIKSALAECNVILVVVISCRNKHLVVTLIPQTQSILAEILHVLQHQRSTSVHLHSNIS